jgi:hypothetical protein
MRCIFRAIHHKSSMLFVIIHNNTVEIWSDSQIIFYVLCCVDKQKKQIIYNETNK